MAEYDVMTTQWTGHDLYDLNGDKIGKIDDVRYGDATGGLKWLVVKTGLLGSKKILVPAGEVRSLGDRLTVSFTKDRVKNAPSVDDDEILTDNEERNLCTYFGLDYAAPSTAEPVEGCVDGNEVGGKDGGKSIGGSRMVA